MREEATGMLKLTCRILIYQFELPKKKCQKRPLNVKRVFREGGVCRYYLVGRAGVERNDALSIEQTSWYNLTTEDWV